jgi:hypothetical protein
VSSCPDREQLALHRAGALLDEEARDLMEHLEGCRTCHDELARLEDVERLLALSRPSAQRPVRDLLGRLVREKAWWIGPLAAALFGLGSLAALFSEGTAFAPFIYSIF